VPTPHRRCEKRRQYHRQNAPNLRLEGARAGPTNKAGCSSNIPRGMAQPYPKWVLRGQPTMALRRSVRGSRGW
jgi:hypothetical protein